MMSGDRDGLHLTLIAEAIADIHRRLAPRDLNAFLVDKDEQALAAFRLSIIGENANKLSPELKGRHPALPWRDMIAFRNIVSHEYHRVAPIRAWEAVEALGEIERMVDIELAALDRG
jgi:uncharacterized protein with HEPN domain